MTALGLPPSKREPVSSTLMCGPTSPPILLKRDKRSVPPTEEGSNSPTSPRRAKDDTDGEQRNNHLVEIVIQRPEELGP